MIFQKVATSSAKNDERARHGFLFLSIVTLFLLFAAVPVLAQTLGKNPFGIGDASPRGPAPTGLIAWILAKQAELTRSMISALRATTTGDGAFALISLAFLYGVLHAAGPGHGKAVVSSYVFANEQAVRRGVGVAIGAAILQAVVAIALVLPAVLLLGATARQIDQGVAWIEIFSFSAILILGLTLTYRKFKTFNAIIAPGPRSVLQESASCAHCNGLQLKPRNNRDRGPQCDHVHLPEASELTGDRSWRDLIAVTIAAGSRPCSGAMILLAFAISVSAISIGIIAVFAMAAGTAITTSAFAIGAVAAKGLTTRIAERSEKLRFVSAGLELVAAIAVALLGGALFAGYIAAG